MAGRQRQTDSQALIDRQTVGQRGRKSKAKGNKQRKEGKEEEKGDKLCSGCGVKR